MLKSECQIPPGVVQVEDLDWVHLQLVCIETDNLSTERLTQLQVESVKQDTGKRPMGRTRSASAPRTGTC
jgi:hypothetical protein